MIFLKCYFKSNLKQMIIEKQLNVIQYAKALLDMLGWY